MDPQPLVALFDLNHRVLTRNTAGVNHEQSLRGVPGGGNCLNWIVGHILASRSGILQLLGEKPIWSEEDAAPYRRGSPALDPRGPARPFESLLADLNRTQEMIRAALGKIRAGALDAPGLADLPGGETVGGQLAFLHFHEAYHAGQTGVVRRSIGLPGAIA